MRRDSDLTAGLTQLIEGNWARSERLLTQGLKHADAPLANYLLAAHAAQLQGAADRRDQWLELAQGISAEGATSALLTRAELQLAAGEPAAAVATLDGARAAAGPTNPPRSRCSRARIARSTIARSCSRCCRGSRARRCRPPSATSSRRWLCRASLRGPI